MNSTGATDILDMDLDKILETSRPRRNPSLLAPMLLAGVLVAIIITLPSDSPFVQPIIPIVFAGLILMSIRHAAVAARRQREEIDALRLAEEGIRLNRWDQARRMLSNLLSRATLRPQMRIQALVYLAGVLSRAERWGDVIKLCEYVQKEAEFIPPVALSVRCMRAYAMLRDDRLSDAYEAIAQMKREFPSGSGILSVMEMYRLVKTGHSEDTLNVFEARRAHIAETLSHRSSEAWALAGTAAFSLGRTEQAMSYLRNASLLGSPTEIQRRYPETRSAFATYTGGEGQVQS